MFPLIGVTEVVAFQREPWHGGGEVDTLHWQESKHFVGFHFSNGQSGWLWAPKVIHMYVDLDLWDVKATATGLQL